MAALQKVISSLSRRPPYIPRELFVSNKFSENSKKLAEARTLALFRKVCMRVPAYGEFLEENGVRASSIRTIADFQKLPFIDKENYLRKYPLDKLVWDGDLSNLKMISRSSGSSGKPYYWPRGLEQEQEVNYVYSNIYKTFFSGDKKKTLIIGGFALGSWVGGTFNLTASLAFADDNPATLVTPGNNKDEIIELVCSLGTHYEQIIIGAYPPFAKEIIDSGVQRGVEWKRFNIKFFCAAETFSEDFRDYILKAVGSKNTLSDSVNIIGTADAAILGHETPLSIAIRREASHKAAFWAELFPAHRTPTLGQYYPWLKYFEELDNSELLFTSNGGIPLMRYNIHDQGSIWPYEKMMNILEDNGYTEASMRAQVDGSRMWQLPFLCIYGKSDQTLPFYGAKVYPENIRSFLESTSWQETCTGKFTMSLEHDQALDPHIKVEVELQHDFQADEELKRKIENELFKHLRLANAEFADASKAVGAEKAVPQVELFEFGDTRFRADLKLTWVKK